MKNYTVNIGTMANKLLKSIKYRLQKNNEGPMRLNFPKQRQWRGERRQVFYV